MLPRVPRIKSKSPLPPVYKPETSARGELTIVFYHSQLRKLVFNKRGEIIKRSKVGKHEKGFPILFLHFFHKGKKKALPLPYG